MTERNKINTQILDEQVVGTHILHPSFWQALKFWFKLGFISFGGPTGQISIMHHELVEQKKWVSNDPLLTLNYFLCNRMGSLQSVQELQKILKEKRNISILDVRRKK